MIVESSPRRVWAGRRGTGIGAVFSHQSQVSAWFSGPCLIAATLFVPSVQPAPSPHGGSGARSPRTRPLTGLWLRQPSPRRAFLRPGAPAPAPSAQPPSPRVLAGCAFAWGAPVDSASGLARRGDLVRRRPPAAPRGSQTPTGARASLALVCRLARGAAHG